MMQSRNDLQYSKVAAQSFDILSTSLSENTMQESKFDYASLQDWYNDQDHQNHFLSVFEDSRMKPKQFMHDDITQYNKKDITDIFSLPTHVLETKAQNLTISSPLQ